MKSTARHSATRLLLCFIATAVLAVMVLGMAGTNPFLAYPLAFALAAAVTIIVCKRAAVARSSQLGDAAQLEGRFTWVIQFRRSTATPTSPSAPSPWSTTSPLGEERSRREH